MIASENPKGLARQAGMTFLRHGPGAEAPFDLQRLRYQIYCQEEQFLDSRLYPHSMESDGFDVHSAHVAAYDQSGKLIGGLRLVLDSPVGFPLEQHTKSLAALQTLPRRKTAEISRLVMTRAYRGGSSLHTDTAVLLGLFKAMYEESVAQELEYWVAGIEPCLWRLLRRFGFQFDPIEPAIEYYGEVMPCLGDIRKIERLVAEKHPEVFKQFHPKAKSVTVKGINRSPFELTHQVGSAQVNRTKEIAERDV